MKPHAPKPTPGNLEICSECDYTVYNVIHKSKPHLRLHYTTAGHPNNRSGKFPWSVEYIRGPSTRARRETYNHDKAWGAIQSAIVLWFPQPLPRPDYSHWQGI